MIDEAFVRMMVVESVKMLNPNADMSDEFDAWLQSVKAAAWDEGFDSGHYAADWESRDCDCRNNPYREADG